MDVCKRNFNRRRRGEDTLGGVTAKKIVFLSTFRQLLPSSDHDVYLHGLDLCFP